MKKTLAIVAALVMAFAATAALAEEPAKMTFSGGVEFNMDMDQVMQILNLPNPEIEREKTRGTTEFWELEYDRVTGENGFTADIKYLFVGNGLVAIHYEMAEGTKYEDVKAELTSTYGATVPFDAAKIGN